MRLIDADSLSEKIQTIIGEDDWKIAMQYMIDTEETIEVDEEESIPVKWIIKWGRHANREYHIALLLYDWRKEKHDYKRNDE